MDRLVPLVCSRKYDLASIITHRLPLCADAYELFDSKRDGCIKVVFDPWLEEKAVCTPKELQTF